MHVQEAPGSRQAWPVSEAEAKEYLGLPDLYSSFRLAMLIEAAARAVERHSGYATTRRQIDVYVGLPAPGQPVAIPYPPLVSLDEVVVIQPDGEQTPLEADADYLLDTSGRVARLWLQQTPPAAMLIGQQRLRLRATVGYESAQDVPAELRLAVLRTVAQMWEQKTTLVVPDVQPLEDPDLCRSWEIE